jgi:radical SAM enzyme (TIGR01210 family)
VLWERERLPGLPPVEAPALAVFLAGAECPFRCVFCDLWRETLDGPTPEGAIERQVRVALREEGPPELSGTVVKLYNASNFFEPRAVPGADLDAVGSMLAPARRVVVECHPRLLLGGGLELCRRFAGRLEGTLEVAMGLETVHPEAFPRLNKGMELDDFARAVVAVRSVAGVEVRAFVLVGVPFVPPEEAVEWAVRSVAHALAAGARNVALIPVRGGNGALEELAARGELEEPRLARLEEALGRALELPEARAGAVVTADLWDLERFAACTECMPSRRARLERANRTGVLEPVPGTCPACGETPA